MLAMDAYPVPVPSSRAREGAVAVWVGVRGSEVAGHRCEAAEDGGASIGGGEDEDRIGEGTPRTVRGQVEGVGGDAGVIRVQNVPRRR